MHKGDEAFDAIVVGAGSGGLTVAVGLAGFGRRVALVEANRVGGDCTNVGCVPSKRLIHLSRDPAGSRDPAAVLAAVRATRDALAIREHREMVADERITLIPGRASLDSGRTVRVAGADGVDRRLTAPHIVVATGSRPRPLEIPGLPPERLLTNERIFELRQAPGHLLIVGAGPIGVEMACAFARMGTRVTIVDVSPRVLTPADPAASEVLEAALAEQGIDVRLGVKVVEYDASVRSLVIDGPAGLEAVPAVDAVLVAIGRVPNVEGFDGHLDTGRGGITVDGWGRTSRRGVWAVGDVTPIAHQTHAANAMGRRIVQRIALPWLPLGRDVPVIPSAVFSDPEVAWVGATARELAERHPPNAIHEIRVEFSDLDRGLTDGVQRGFIAVAAIRPTGRVVSATVVGPHASELLPLLTFAIDRRVSLLRLQRLVYAYPTFAGALGAVADEFARRTLPHLRAEVAGYVRRRSPLGGRRRHHPADASGRIPDA